MEELTNAEQRARRPRRVASWKTGSIAYHIAGSPNARTGILIAIDGNGEVRVGCRALSSIEIVAWLSINDDARGAVAETLLATGAVNAVVD